MNDDEIAKKVHGRTSCDSISDGARKFPLLILFTDFGHGSYYAGQMEARCRALAPEASCVILTHEAPRCDPRRAGLLLAALRRDLPQEAVFLCVVDPGVGSARHPLMVWAADGSWFVGPDNGLLVAAAGAGAAWFTIDWRPERCSDTFHGRDLFAPVAARLARGEKVACSPLERAPIGSDWPRSLWEIIDIDRFGNLISGVSSVDAPPVSARLRVNGRTIAHARCFSEVERGALFWYINSIGLLEVAANGARAEHVLGAESGDAIQREEVEDGA